MKKVIDYYSKGTPKQVITRALITLAIIVILYFVGKKIYKEYKEAKAKKDAEEAAAKAVEDAAKNQTLIGFSDGSQMTENEAIMFGPTAALIADQQYGAMASTGTDEDTLFNTLLDLNGAKLNMVLTKFGVRDGKNLFQWYTDELCGGGLFAGCTSMAYYNDAVPGCNSWADDCSELKYMQQIWKRWNNNTPF